MSFSGDIDGSLAAMTTGVGRAQEATAAADAAAGQIAARAAGSGFVGVAQAMARVRDAIREVHAQVTGVGDSVDEARTAVASAPDQMSPQQTIAVLAVALERIGTVHTGIGAAVATVDQVRQLASASLHGGRPGPMLARLDAIKQVLVAVAQRGNTARQQVETALAEVRKTGDAGNLAAGGGDTSRTPAASQVPDFVERIAATMPYPTVGEQTVGMITDPAGRALRDDRIISGSDGPGWAPAGQPSPGLRPDYPPSRWESAKRHVEGHTAALMRQPDGPRDVVLVVSKEPCGPPWGCDVILARILPSGSRLSVYVAERGQPARFYKTYDGTGRGVQA